jgi:eukaryotic-like serine/threonine-protein kinase
VLRATVPQPGVVLGNRYRLIQQLGRGGMAEVWRGFDARMQRPVAIKVFNDDLDDSVSVARQLAEIRALADLSHPNLVAFLDARHVGDGMEKSGDPAYLVMEFVEGPTLAQRLTLGPLSVGEVGEIARGVAAALAAAHSHGMVHRDVKPANILLAREGSGRLVPKLSDFGIAHRLGSGRITRTSMVVGTAAYLSPEQARGGTIGPATDVYALGLVLLEALTGRRTYDGPPLEAAAARLHRPPGIPATLPAPWPSLLAAMTQLDPTTRPSASVVLGVLEGRAQVPVRSVPARPVVTVAPPVRTPAYRPAERPAEPPKRARRRHRRVSGLAALITVMTFIALAAFAVAVLTSH